MEYIMGGTCSTEPNQTKNYGYIFGQTNLKNFAILVDLLIDGVV